MRTILLAICLYLGCPQGFAFEGYPALNRDSFALIREDLKQRFGQHKHFEPALELECLAALSFYPELAATRIRFRFGKPAPTMVSRPCLPGTLFPGKTRSYVIIIRQPGRSHNGLDWTELSFNALVGWIGHELSHIVQYEHVSVGGMITLGIQYAIPARRRKIERFTDFVTIRHSLGMSLYEGTDHAINRSLAKDRYKRYLSKYYLLPDEIRRYDSTAQQYSLSYHHTRFRLMNNN